jgi:hypothetical protein
MTWRLRVGLAVACASAAPLLTVAQTSVRIEQLRWLTGCWEMNAPQRTIEEHWLPPRGGTMLGMGRTVQDGRTIEYESIVIRVENDRLAYEAHPSGQPSAVFLSQQMTASSVVFENLTHDFPQRVGYERRGEDAVMAWIEGTQNGRTRRTEFSYQRMSCR